MEASDTQEKGEQKSTTPAKPIDLTQLAGIAGAASILTVFISALSSWAFARGLLSRLGLPAQLVTLRSGIDFLPGMAFFIALVFVASLATGFITTAPTTGRQRRVRPLICTAIVVSLLILAQPDTTDAHSLAFVRALSFVAIIAPISVGYLYKSLVHRKGRMPTVFLAVVLILSVWTKALYDYGFEVGTHIVTNDWSWLPKGGMVEVKPGDFPRVTIRTREKLTQLADGDRDGDGYIYPSGDSGYMRLVVRDESEYYFVNSTNGVANVFSIRKDLVSQIFFLEEERGVSGKIANEK
jgi:hypothetical protein